MTATPPTAEKQLSFLSKVQRLFAEGDFTATYKFALLISLCELAVERGADNSDPLRLTMLEIAAKFAELYWQQVTPFKARGAAAKPGILSQNNGAQAAVVNAIVRFRNENAYSSAQVARSAPAFPALLREIARTVASQPISYLQNFGGVTDEFLYSRISGGIELLPGVGYCLRRFQPLIQQFARSRWIDHVERNQRNALLLGDVADLEQFLFETPRKVLEGVARRFTALFGDRCFYCGRRYSQADVDHFIPFATYPRDLIHNFVVAHPECNRSKSDSLAAKQHLDAWLARVRARKDDLAEIGDALGIPGDVTSSHAIAGWAYEAGHSSSAHAWVRARVYEPIDKQYVDRFTDGI